MKNLRTVERLTDGEYVKIPFQELKKGDTFRMFNPDGEPVIWKEDTIFYAMGDPYLYWFDADQYNEAGDRWTIETCLDSEKGEIEVNDAV